MANISVDNQALHTACLSAWALLSTLLQPSQIFETIDRWLLFKLSTYIQYVYLFCDVKTIEIYLHGVFRLQTSL